LRRRAALRCAVMLVTDPPERPVRWQGESGEDLAGDGGVGRVEAVQVFRRTACRGSRDKAKLAGSGLSGGGGKRPGASMGFQAGSKKEASMTRPAQPAPVPPEKIKAPR